MQGMFHKSNAVWFIKTAFVYKRRLFRKVYIILNKTMVKHLFILQRRIYRKKDVKISRTTRTERGFQIFKTIRCS